MSGLSMSIKETIVMALYQFEMMDRSIEAARLNQIFPHWEWTDAEEFKLRAISKYRTDPVFYTKVHSLTSHILATIDRQQSIDRLGIEEVERREAQERLQAMRVLSNMGSRTEINYRTSIFSRKEMRFVET